MNHVGQNDSSNNEFLDNLPYCPHAIVQAHCPCSNDALGEWHWRRAFSFKVELLNVCVRTGLSWLVCVRRV